MPSLWAWGTGQAGQLGDGEGKASLLPTGVSDATFSANIRQIAAGESHCVALDDAGAVYAWGRTREGQAGRVDPTPQKEPVVISSLLEHTVNKIACGALTCYALTADGVVHAWGCLHESAADAEIHDDAAGYGRAMHELPERMQRMLRSSVSQFLAGDDDGSLADGGGADGGAPGAAAADVAQGFRRVARPQPVPLPGLEAVAAGRRAVDVAGGFSFGLVLLEDGTVIGHGFNDRFQLGLGDRSLRPTPTPIPMFDVFAVPITQIACGQQHSAALDRDGDLYTWGFGAFGATWATVATATSGALGASKRSRRCRRVPQPAATTTPSCCCVTRRSPPTTGPPRGRRRSGASGTQNGVSWAPATTAAPARRRATLRRRGR